MADGLRNPIPFDCPFCRGKCCAGYALSDDTPVVLHSMPYCSHFARDEGPEKFLEAVNEQQRMTQLKACSTDVILEELAKRYFGEPIKRVVGGVEIILRTHIGTGG